MFLIIELIEFSWILILFEETHLECIVLYCTVLE